MRQETEGRLREVAAAGAVVLGRAGACALLDTPSVLRVRLYGPAPARLAQAARLPGIPTDEAAARLEPVDRVREDYVRRLYGRSADDPSLCQLPIDSTVLPPPGVAALIPTASERLSSR